MGLDRRTFLTSLSIAPAAALVPACQPAQPVTTVEPTVKALRDVVLEPMSEPALVFVPLRRPT